MSKMGTNSARGRKRARIVAVTLVFALLATCVTAVSASAFYWPWDDIFNIQVANGKAQSTSMIGSSKVSITETLNLADVFSAEKGELQNVQAVQVVANNAGRYMEIQLKLDKNGDQHWTDPTEAGNYTSCKYTNKNGISYSDFNRLMAQITLNFNPDSKVKAGDCTLRITAYTNTQATKQITKPYRDYVCIVSFFGFAEGSADDTSAKVSYEADGNHYAEPLDEAGGTVSFDMNVTDAGGASVIRYGYQYKESSLPWITGINNSYDEETGEPIGVITDFTNQYDPERGETEPITVNELTKGEDNLTQKLHMTIKGLKAGVDYDVRGVFVTDDKESTPTFTNSFSVKYEKPQINSFNIGNTTKDYNGTKDTMNLSMKTNFPNTNYEEATYTVDGVSYTGPHLKSNLYFTTKRAYSEAANGKLVDNSVWIPIESLSEIHKVTDEESRTYTKSWNDVKLPSKLLDLVPASIREDGPAFTAWKAKYGLSGVDFNAPVNSRACAFKLEVTDLGCGYSTYRISDPFTVDSSIPKAPKITAEKDGVQQNLTLADAFTVGGKGSQVELTIAGSMQVETDDGKETDPSEHPENFGSKLKGYSYSIYYLPTDKAVGNSVSEILTGMSSYNKNNHGAATYTDWAELAVEDNVDGAKVTISQDGYYRVDARASDMAGFITPEEDIVSAYFRVDLTPPNRPTAYLLKQKAAGNTDLNSGFEKYDNSTYTESTVWLFAYSEPITGKKIAKFQYSPDGGLNWYDALKTDTKTNNGVPANMKITSAATSGADANKITTGTKTVKENNGQGNITFQIGINLSGMDEDDYTAILVQAIDDNGNESLASEPVIMRTIAKTPAPTSALQHQGVELALAMGNTTMSSDTLTAELKNAAAKKINAAFYGTGGSSDPNNKDYNAWVYGSYNGVKVSTHNCTWGSDTSCKGPCKDTNCPYAHLTQYELYTPEMINVQGMEGKNATDKSQFPWVRYDHTMFNIMPNDRGGTVQIPTASYIDDNKLVTNLKPSKTQAAYKYNGQVRYTASQDRVMYMGQTSASQVDADGLPTENYNGFTSGTFVDKFTGFGTLMSWYTGAAGGGFPANGTVITAKKEKDGPDVTYTYTSIPAVDSYSQAGHWFKENNYDDWNANDYGVKGWGEATIARRIYHLMDTSTAADPINGYADLNKEGDMSTIAGYNGYLIGSFRDWLFLYNDQPTKKEISYSITDTQINAHSADFQGFLFNSTIRQNKDGKWRLSGYMFMDGDAIVETVGTPRPPTNYKWWIIKINDVNMEHFSDGCLSSGGGVAAARVDDDIPLYLISHPTQGPLKTFPDGGSLDTIAYSEHDTTAVCTRHYRLVTEGDYTTLYVFNSGSDMSWDKGKLDEKFSVYSDLAATEMPSASTTNCYKAINWKEYYGSTTSIGTKLYTPRPVVDGIQIGSKQARQAGYHTDTNCYGFGPIIGARSAGHGCYIDSRVVFTNISLKMNVARKLSEVVNEPQWGGGKAKFIANLSDDSIDDFQDPVLSSQIQWRLFTDKAKFIGWGGYDNGTTTKAFIDRIDGDGMYEYTEDKNYNLLNNHSQQVNNVAEYITQQYYSSFGFNVAFNDSGTMTSNAVRNQVQEKVSGTVSGGVSGKGAVYSLSDMANISFSVTPDEYNSSSANPDYPAGRWYIVHDTNGYGTAQQSARHESYSDALELNITEPGRYSIYFAPDAQKVADKTLDPDDPTCIFDFIVNTPPVAEFTGEIGSDGTVTIKDSSYDPDNGKSDPEASSKLTQPSELPKYVWYKDGVKQPEKSYTGAPVAGVDTSLTEWRWELLGKQQNSETLLDELYVVASSGGWHKESPSGKTLATLTGNVRSALQSGEVFTVYQRVTDVSARKVAQYDASGKFAGYTFKAVAGTKSSVLQQNLTGNGGTGLKPTYAPLSAFSLSSTAIYHTADDTSLVSLSRASKQTQGEGFKVSWAVDSNGTYRKLVRVQGSYDYYLCSSAFYDKEAKLQSDADKKGETFVGPSYVATLAELTADPGPETDKEIKGYGVAAGAEPILRLSGGNPASNDNGGTTKLAEGVWTISKKTVKSLLGNAYGKIVLQMTETAHGYTAAEVARPVPDEEKIPTDIVNSSARAIYYSQDALPPSAQTVTTNTLTYNGSGNPATDPDWNNHWLTGTYEASNYLDVTNDDKLIQLSVGGSVDAEGKLDHYSYYFYDRNANLKPGQNGYETTYYYMDSTGKLKSTGTDKETAIKNGKLSAAGGQIRIRNAAMNGKNLASINVAVFAEDNGGNRTAVTRVDDIKLSVTKPMPPAITATNNLGQVVSGITNGCGYRDSSKWDKDENGNPIPDDMYTDPAIDYFTNSAVTVQFAPRQAYFAKKTEADGSTTYTWKAKASDKNVTGASLMYEDVYQEADRTSAVMVRYTVRHKEKASDSFTVYQNMENMEVASTVNLTFTEDGIYEITAQVRNDAKTLSDERKISFTIDRTPPAAPKVEYRDEGRLTDYIGDVHAKSVTVTVDGSARLPNNPDGTAGAPDPNAKSTIYRYSLDNGASWKDEHILGDVLQAKTFKLETTGVYDVRVKAVDKAGNESQGTPMTVLIDAAAPVVGAPSLKAGASNEAIYKAFLISTRAVNGKIGAVSADDSINTTDTEFTVEAGADQKFYILPNEGYKLASLEYNGVSVLDDTANLGTDSRGTYYIAREVRKDAALTANFVEVGTPDPSYMAMARTASANALRSSRAATAQTFNAGTAEGNPSSVAENEVSMAASVLSDLVDSSASSQESSSEAQGASSESSILDSSETSSADPSSSSGPEESGGTDPEPEPSPDPAPDPDPEMWKIELNPIASQCSMSAEPLTVPNGGSSTITIIPKLGYQLEKLMVGASTQEKSFEVLADDEKMSCDPSTGVYTYVLEAIDDNFLLTPVMKPVQTRALTISAGEHGTAKLLAGSGVASGPVTEKNGDLTYMVYVGKPLTFEVATQEQYMVSQMTIDGIVIDTMSGTTGSSIPYTGYVVPAFDKEGTDPGIKVSVTFDVSGDTFWTIDASIATLEGEEPHGTISPEGTVKVPDKGTQKFIIRANPTYEAEVWVRDFTGEGDDGWEFKKVEIGAGLDKTENENEWIYSFDNVQRQGYEIQVIFRQITYSVAINQSSGGTIKVKSEPEVTAWGVVPEGTRLEFEFVPDEGYKVKDVKVTDANGVNCSIGARGYYTVDYLKNSTPTREFIIGATFEARDVDRIKSTHYIDAYANEVADLDDGLAEEPYSFRIGVGNVWSDWSAWQKSNYMHYDNVLPASGGEPIELKPNQKYTVEVRARDVVGNSNESSPASGDVWTWANIPLAESAEAMDTRNDESQKKVAVTVDVNGNPADTEYLVYYSTSKTMSSMTPAPDGWKTLQSGNIYTVSGLAPGRRYYMIVIARNKAGYSTEVNTKNVVDVMLTPAAPPANTFYFEEQDTPGGGITLTWDTPPADVLSVEIFRGDMWIASVPVSQSSYTDPGTSLRGDGFYTYSYAFVNSAGTGSRRTAVSKEYHDANNTEGFVKRDAMDNLRDKYNYDYYSDVMTYPAFPKEITKEIASIRGGANSGEITVRVQTESGVSARKQKYKLGLRAYYPPNSKENPTDNYVEVPTSVWNPKLEENLRVTTTPDGNGAKATWLKLNSDLEYTVFVEEIYSTGRWVVDPNDGSWVDGYNTANESVEVFLQKTYTVNEQGYSMKYGNTEDAEKATLNTIPLQPWKEGELEEYMKHRSVGSVWGDSLYKDGYIKFNKSPECALPETADLLYQGNGSKIKLDSSGSPYLLVDQSTSDMTFKINVYAWDIDGSPQVPVQKYPNITGKISGANGKSILEPTEIILPTEKGGLFTLIFDGKDLDTGCYTDLEITATDGEVSTTLMDFDHMKLIVNRTIPGISVEGGTDVRKLEVGKIYKESVIQAEAVLKDFEGWSTAYEVRLAVMSDQFLTQFGTDVYGDLQKRLTDPADAGFRAEYLENAKKLLAEEFDSHTQSVGGQTVLTSEGVNLVIDRMAPPLTGYFEIDEATYQALQAEQPEATMKSKFRVEPGSNGTFYWIEQEFALNYSGNVNDGNLVPWLQKESNGLRVLGKKGDSHSIEIVATFGGNTYPVELHFTLANPAKAEVLSDKYWGWQKTSKAEYTVYAEAADGTAAQGGYSIGDVLKKYKLCYTADQRPTDVNESDPAYDATELDQSGNPVYKVYKLKDNCATITDIRITVNLELDTGVHDRFAEGGVIFAPMRFGDNGEPLDDSEQYDPAKEGIDIEGVYPSAITGSIVSKTYRLKADLASNTTYCVWTYYKVTDDSERVYSQKYVAMTTDGDYDLSYYGFSRPEDSYTDTDAKDEPAGRKVALTVSRMGAMNVNNATLTATAEYYKADDFGKILTDTNGDPIPVDDLAMAQSTLFFDPDDGDTVTFTASGKANSDIVMRLMDNKEQQGHMVVRLRLQLIPDRSDGYNIVQTDSETIDIAILDAQSLSTYKLALVNEPNAAGKTLTQKAVDSDGRGIEYYYQLKGLPVDYNYEQEELTVTYKNAGTGALSNISAKVYTRKDRESPESTAFEISSPPYVNSLLPTDGEDKIRTGQVKVRAKAGLSDLEHTGWLCLSSTEIDSKPGGEIWIELSQVVGQSTLCGRIYIGPSKPLNDFEPTGTATVYLYPGTTVYNATTNQFSKQPLYSVETNALGGYYEIPNIKNGQNYKIVVMRDGYLAYNQPWSSHSFQIGEAGENGSHTYQFDLRLYGGDIDGNQFIETTDFELFSPCYNKTYDVDAQVFDEDSELAMLRRCDFNSDGVVNALDRVVIWGNEKKSSRLSYDYVTAPTLLS